MDISSKKDAARSAVFSRSKGAEERICPENSSAAHSNNKGIVKMSGPNQHCKTFQSKGIINKNRSAVYGLTACKRPHIPSHCSNAICRQSRPQSRLSPKCWCTTGRLETEDRGAYLNPMLGPHSDHSAQSSSNL